MNNIVANAELCRVLECASLAVNDPQSVVRGIRCKAGGEGVDELAVVWDVLCDTRDRHHVGRRASEKFDRGKAIAGILVSRISVAQSTKQTL